jgi:HSP20 family protein
MPARSRVAPPLVDADELRDHLEDALDHWFSGTRGWSPAIDVIRRPGELLVLADVPGLKSQDFRIAVEGAALTIAGTRDDLDAGEGASYLREERRSGPFSRSVALPAAVDPARIEAKLEDGLLELTVPLPAESDPEPVRITPSE